jgi:hypothetical protein
MKLLETHDDTVYVQFKHRRCVEPTSDAYAGIDWLALAKQKMTLLTIIDSKIIDDATAENLDGLVSLIDSIQDDAEAKNYPVVWAYPKEMLDSGVLHKVEENDE